MEEEERMLCTTYCMRMKNDKHGEGKPQVKYLLDNFLKGCYIDTRQRENYALKRYASHKMIKVPTKYKVRTSYIVRSRIWGDQVQLGQSPLSML